MVSFHFFLLNVNRERTKDRESECESSIHNREIARDRVNQERSKGRQTRTCESSFHAFGDTFV